MDAYWRFLEDNAHRVEVQRLIQREIRNGTIRVIPGPKGIWILPQVDASFRASRTFDEIDSMLARSTLSAIG